MAASQPKMLPPHSKSSSFVTIRSFETGRMFTPAKSLVEDAQGMSTATSWRFLITHLQSGTNLWFDMGISADLTNYTPAICALHAHFKPLPAKTSIEEDTISSSIAPSAISYVIISHAHWDHIHPLPASFTNATMLIGPGTTAHCTPCYPTNPDSKFNGLIFDPSLRKFPLQELPPPSSSSAPSASSSSSAPVWNPLGPFPHAYDFFGDGSFYLIDAPGHMAGNMAALARVQTQQGKMKWVLLAGDCAHCNLFTYWPEAPFGHMDKRIFVSGTLHEKAEEARVMIRKVAECKRVEGEGLLVWYAHGEFLEGVWEL